MRIVESIADNFKHARRVLLNYYEQEATQPALWKHYDEIAANILELLDSFIALNGRAPTIRIHAVWQDVDDLAETVKRIKSEFRAACGLARLELIARQHSEFEAEPNLSPYYNEVIPIHIFYSIVGRALNIANVLNMD